METGLQNKKSIKKLSVIGILFALAVVLTVTAILRISADRNRTRLQNTGLTDNPPAEIEEINLSDAEYDSSGGYVLAAQSDKLKLYCNPDTGAVMVEDTRNGYVWKSIADESVYDQSGVNAFYRNQMNSLFMLQYMSREAAEKSITQDAVTTFAFSNDKNNKITFYRVQDGLGMLFYIDAAKIEIALEFSLEDDKLTVYVPGNRIKEYEGARIISVTLMPYFGAAGMFTDGYMLVPDGCGALVIHGNADQRFKNIKGGTWGIYGPERVTAGETQENIAALPVYGIKNGENAILAAACEGEEDNSISVMPSGTIIDLDRAYFTLRYRYSYQQELSHITLHGVNPKKVQSVLRYADDIIRTDRTVKYFFLCGDEADYSGMANAYREYLVQTGGLKKAVGLTGTIPLSLELFMGTVEKTMLYDKFITMTTFAEAESICNEFINLGVDNMEVTLNGWSKGGYGKNPVVWPPEGNIGGRNGLREFIEYTLNSGIKTYLRQNFVYANAGNRGFSTRRDTVSHGSGLPVTDVMKNFLLNTDTVVKNARYVLDRINKYSQHTGNLSGMAFDVIGALVFHDFSSTGIIGRDSTIAQWCGIMEMAADKNRPVAVEAGNLYVLRYADRLYNIPEENSKYWGQDIEVPFYQMVVHGYIPYTSEPGNLSSDLGRQKLKWVEYGSMPHFELTKQESFLLINTKYNMLFTSHYMNWCERASEIYKEFNSRISSIWGEPIIRHDRISDTLRRVEYGDGTKVYINYGDNKANLDGYEIPPMDYIVVGSGGEIK